MATNSEQKLYSLTERPDLHRELTTCEDKSLWEFANRIVTKKDEMNSLEIRWNTFQSSLQSSLDAEFSKFKDVKNSFISDYEFEKVLDHQNSRKLLFSNMDVFVVLNGEKFSNAQQIDFPNGTTKFTLKKNEGEEFTCEDVVGLLKKVVATVKNVSESAYFKDFKFVESNSEMILGHIVMDNFTFNIIPVIKSLFYFLVFSSTSPISFFKHYFDTHLHTMQLTRQSNNCFLEMGNIVKVIFDIWNDKYAKIPFPLQAIDLIMLDYCDQPEGKSKIRYRWNNLSFSKLFGGILNHLVNKLKNKSPLEGPFNKMNILSNYEKDSKETSRLIEYIESYSSFGENEKQLVLRVCQLQIA